MCNVVTQDCVGRQMNHAFIPDFLFDETLETFDPMVFLLTGGVNSQRFLRGVELTRTRV